ncbi:MAG: lamin tail domain-containing protein [Verrucomicrobia bacterium]|nr:lamin tail domain-containing protein [Verrucomicrobiota bacterium]
MASADEEGGRCRWSRTAAPRGIFALLCFGLLAGRLNAAERVVINEIHFDPPEKKPLQFIELFNPGTAAVGLAGWSLNGFPFTNGARVGANGFVVVARHPAAFEREFGFRPFGPLPEKLGHHRDAVTLRDAAGQTVDAVNYSTGFPWPTVAEGAGPSMERVHPSLPGDEPGSWRSAGCLAATSQSKRPSPGKQNSVFSPNPPPLFREIIHKPPQPKSGEAVTVTARVAAPAGLKSVTLELQVVEPGRYLRKTDPAYATNWQSLPMRDDGREGDARAGDGVFTTVVPAEIQKHRRLVRYRLNAVDHAGSGLRVPYADDESPNFAWFVYDGLPAWTGASRPGRTPPMIFSPEFLGTLPAYHLLARAEDVERSQWDGNSDKKRFSGMMVYDGRVYDHIQFRNRGKASTYVAGKNKWGFKFNRGHEFQARDLWGKPYQQTWDSFNMNPCSSPWAPVNRGMAGMDEAVSFRAYHLAGVPSPSTHWIQFRVVDAAEEAPARSQYDGDLWGLYHVVQDPDGAWLHERGLPDGNVYYPESGRKHLAEGMPADDSDWHKFTAGPRGHAESWWRTNLDLPVYYSFHALNRVLGNVDLRPGANHYFYRPPDGRWAVVPWDLDMMFIPKTHQPGFIDQTRCLDVPALRREYQERAREILDLFCADASPNGGQIGQLVDELAAVLCPPGQARSWPELDMAMWNWHPRSHAHGAFYVNPCGDNRFGGSWTRTLATPDFAGFRKYIVDFCTDSRPTKRYAPNDGDQRGYGFGYLWFGSRDDKVLPRPAVQYAGPTGFPAKELMFKLSASASPQATSPVVAIQWRVGRLSAPGLAGYQPGQPRRYELEPFWTSEEIAPSSSQGRLPADLCKPGHTYRVRARCKDASGRWSHWSEPVQFVAGR